MFYGIGLRATVRSYLRMVTGIAENTAKEEDMEKEN
jgi:hypothetical protein